MTGSDVGDSAADCDHPLGLGVEIGIDDLGIELDQQRGRGV